MAPLIIRTCCVKLRSGRVGVSVRTVLSVESAELTGTTLESSQGFAGSFIWGCVPVDSSRRTVTGPGEFAAEQARSVPGSMRSEKVITTGVLTGTAAAPEAGSREATLGGSVSRIGVM